MGMDIDMVNQDLIRRFAAPLPEFYQRRIIFWYDEEREFEDQIRDLSLDGVTVVTMTIGSSICSCTARSSAPTSIPFGWTKWACPLLLLSVTR